ncbi:MAG: class I SAM-dependent methyltransferase [Alphaproteobacteria bacterium]|nr:class I SAM-dependent methyltransferase [Alphaproteobacteria bacterium]
MSKADCPKHLAVTDPSPWVARWAPLIRPNGSVLDVAAGGGRHGRFLMARGHAVTFVDRSFEPLADLAGRPGAEVIEADLETGAPWPFKGRPFAAVVVVNYLHRPLFEDLILSLEPGGVLIYETFARGNEDFARPRNPDHLLKAGELLHAVTDRLQIVAYEHGLVGSGDIPGVKQRLCAVNDLGTSNREDGEPPVHGISRV